MRASPATSSARPPYTSYITPLTLSFSEQTPCAPKRPVVQSKARPRPVHIRRKVHKPPVLKPVVFKPHRRPLPATLAELARPVRCEVVRSSTLYQPAALVLPGQPMIGATPYLPIPGLNQAPLITLDQVADYRGPSLFPNIPPIIGGGGRKTQTGSGDTGGPPGGTTNPPGKTGPTLGGVSAAPEPAEWALYASGVGLLGLMLRRRRAATA